MRSIVFAVVVVGVVFAGLGTLPGIASANQIVSGAGDLDHWASDQFSLDSHSWGDRDWHDHGWHYGWRNHDMGWWADRDAHSTWSADDKWTLGSTGDDPSSPDTTANSGPVLVPSPSSGDAPGPTTPVSPTPEPSSLLLLTSVLPGLVGVGAVVRRRRKSAR